MSQSETSAAAVEAALDRGELALADALLAALDTADRAGDPTLLGLHRRVEEGRGTRLAQLGHVQAFVARHPALAAHPRVLVEEGLALQAHGAMPEARVELLRALDALDRGPDDAWTRATALAGIGLTHFAPLDAERARRSLTEARAVAARAGLLERVCHADLYLAHVEIEAGEVDRAAHAYRRAVATYEQLGDEAGVRHASYNLGMCLSDLGRDRSARRHLLRCKEIAERRSEGWWAAWATIILGELERKAGRAEAARAAWDRAEAAFRASRRATPTERAWLEVRRGELALDLGDLRLAEASARAIHAEGVEPTPRMYGRLILAIVRARRRPASAGRRAYPRRDRRRCRGPGAQRDRLARAVARGCGRRAPPRRAAPRRRSPRPSTARDRARSRAARHRDAGGHDGLDGARGAPLVPLRSRPPRGRSGAVPERGPAGCGFGPAAHAVARRPIGLAAAARRDRRDGGRGGTDRRAPPGSRCGDRAVPGRAGVDLARRRHRPRARPRPGGARLAESCRERRRAGRRPWSRVLGPGAPRRRRRRGARRARRRARRGGRGALRRRHRSRSLEGGRASARRRRRRRSPPSSRAPRPRSVLRARACPSSRARRDARSSARAHRCASCTSASTGCRRPSCPCW